MSKGWGEHVFYYLLKGMIKLFCPKCKYEYREGFTKCPDCNVPLVDKLPEKIKPQKFEMNYTEFELVYTSLKYSDIAQIRSIFDSEGITYYIQGEDMGVAPGGLPARVLVKKEEAETAKELLQDFNLM